MGKGIDLARPTAPEHAQVMDDFKDQLLIVLMKRLQKLSGPVSIPVAECDDTGQDLLALSITDRTFHFTLSKKQ